MTNREKVKNALRRCKSYGDCEDEGCPYYYTVGCLELLRKEALALLKEQEKEIENLKEIIKKADYTLEIAKDKLNDLLKKTEGR